jgi:AraC-like DNA-binding protein
VSESSNPEFLQTLYSIFYSLQIYPVSLVSPGSAAIQASYLTHAQESSDSNFQLICVEEGQGWHRINGCDLWVESGSLFLIRPDDAYDLSGLDGSKYWNIVFKVDLSSLTTLTHADGKLLQPNEQLLVSLLRIKEVEKRHFKISPSACPHWISRLHQLKFELTYAPVGFTTVAQLLLILLLINTAKLAKPQLNQCSKPYQQLLTSVFCFIQENYSNGISLCDVAKAVERSPTYLTDLMRRETGRTVLGWIIEYRLSEARRLLVTTSESIEKIANLLGYPDTGYFIRQFRKHTGVPPQTWRQEKLNMHMHVSTVGTLDKVGA